MEESDIVDAVAHHDKAIESDVDEKAAPDVGVKPSGAEYVRMRRTARHNFNPPRAVAGRAALAIADLAAHVDFKARLDEREEARAHTDGNVASEHAF